MRTLAFYFAGEQDAADAMAALRAENGLSDTEIETAPLVVDGEDGTVLALSVDVSRAERVEEIVEENGGRVVANVPEEWL